MKVKALAIVAFSGLFAATLAFASPATTDSADMMPADDNSMMQGPSNSSGNVGGMSNNTMQNNDGSQPADTGNDDMSADTATGDDY